MLTDVAPAMVEDRIRSPTRIPQNFPMFLGDPCRRERQGAGVRPKQNIDVIVFEQS